MKKEVTAIITCMTDGERPFVREALLSVQQQTTPCETILVVESANPWIDAIAAEFPDVVVLRRPLAWAGAARNSGVNAATTEFVAFLDGDDVWLPEKTSKQLAHLRASQGHFVGVDHVLMTEDGQAFAYALARHLPMPSGWMVRRDVMMRYPFDPDVGRGLEDGAWWLSTWDSIYKQRLPEPLINYRVRVQSMSSAEGSKRRKLALSKLSALPIGRPLLLAGTYVMHSLYRRGEYVPLKEWGSRANPATAARAAN